MTEEEIAADAVERLKSYTLKLSNVLTTAGIIVLIILVLAVWALVELSTIFTGYFWVGDRSRRATAGRRGVVAGAGCTAL